MNKGNAIALATVLTIGVCTCPASAYSIDTCHGHARGPEIGVVFRVNRCSITAGGSREAAMLYGMNEWSIPGSYQMFFTTSGSSSCSTTFGDGNWDISVVSPSVIDNAAGLTRIRRRSCNILREGWTIEADVMVASDITNTAQNPDSYTLGARETWAHEFGHVLALNHYESVLSVMCASNTCGKTADFDRTGVDNSSSEGTFPDDVKAKLDYYSASGSSTDLFVSPWWHSGGVPSLANSTAPIAACPGDPVTVYATHGSKAKNTISCSAAAGSEIVVSTNTIISMYDQRVAYWGLCAPTRGAYWTNPYTFTVPSNLAAGTYYVGIVADESNTLAEGNEGNNAVRLRTLIVKSSGC